MKRILLLAAVLFAVVSANAQFINTPSSQSQPKTQTKSSSSGDVTFCGEFNAGMMIGKTKYDDEKIDGTMIAPVFTGTFGVKMNDYLFLGAGTGVKYMIQNWESKQTDYYYTEEDKYTISSLMLPLYVELKVLLPVNETVYPFVMADFGYSVRLAGEIKCDYKGYDEYYYGNYSGTDKRDTEGGLCYKFGGGVAISDFIITFGYDCQKFGVKDFDKDFKSSGFFFSLGYAF